MPKPEAEEYYHADLIGLDAVLGDGTRVGRVRAIYDFGAGDTLEIERSGAPPAMVPFTRAIVPVVEIEAGRLVIDPLPGPLRQRRGGSMTQITKDHVEWAVVGRLRLMLEEPPHATYNVTQAYSLFSAILCWVMQHIRSPTDRIAHRLFESLSEVTITNDPWLVHSAPAERIERIGPYNVKVPAPVGFEMHTVDRFLINLRDATAHRDARNVSPFNIAVGSEQLLAGFSFACAEFGDRKRTKKWCGKITLLDDDMRRIGVALAKRYCDSLRRSDPHRRDSNFGNDAALVKEAA